MSTLILSSRGPRQRPTPSPYLSSPKVGSGRSSQTTLIPRSPTSVASAHTWKRGGSAKSLIARTPSPRSPRQWNFPMSRNLTLPLTHSHSGAVANAILSKKLKGVMRNNNAKFVIQGNMALDAATEEHIVANRDMVTMAINKKIEYLQSIGRVLEESLKAQEQQCVSLQEVWLQANQTMINKRGPLALAESRLLIRSRRPYTERMSDDVEKALYEEVAELRGHIQQLTNLIAAAHDQYGRLEACRAEMALELERKHSAIEVEKECLQVPFTAAQAASSEGLSSSHLGKHFEIEVSQVDTQSWKANVDALLERGEHLVQGSVHLRQMFETAMEAINTSAGIAGQQTNKCLQAILEHNHQRLAQLQHHAQEVDAEIESIVVRDDYISKEIANKQSPLAVAQKRLEVRRKRPQEEAVKDEVESALVQEVEELLQVIELLQNNLQNLRQEEERLVELRQRLHRDLENCQSAFNLDQQCWDLTPDSLQKIEYVPHPPSLHATVHGIRPNTATRVTSARANKRYSDYNQGAQGHSPSRSSSFTRSRSADGRSRSVDSSRSWPKLGFAKDPAIPTSVKWELFKSFPALAGGPVVNNFERATRAPWRE